VVTKATIVDMSQNVKFYMKFDIFFHGLLEKRDKSGDHWKEGNRTVFLFFPYIHVSSRSNPPYFLWKRFILQTYIKMLFLNKNHFTFDWLFFNAKRQTEKNLKRTLKKNVYIIFFQTICTCCTFSHGFNFPQKITSVKFGTNFLKV
jgi:hypothetical protein